MTKQEIIKKLDELDRKQLYLMMADHWERRDFDENDRLTREIAMLTAELRKLEMVEG